MLDKRSWFSINGIVILIVVVSLLFGANSAFATMPTPTPPLPTSEPEPNASILFSLKWGSFGTANGQFNEPHGIAVDSSGNVYVVELLNHRIQKFSSDGTFLTTWGSSDAADGQFKSPYNIAVDSSDNVYVAYSGNSGIQKFSSDGTFLTKWGSYGTADGQFSSTISIAVDSSGNVYVAEYMGHRIQKFSSDGTFLTTWGSFGTADGQFSQPNGIAVDSSGNVYVVDHRIQKFSSDGTFLAKWGSSQGTADGQFSFPYGIAVDSSDNVYVVDALNSRIQKFSSDGTFLTTWGSGGTADCQFVFPIGIAVDSSGNIYVADRDNHSIQKFLDITTTTPEPEHEPLSSICEELSSMEKTLDEKCSRLLSVDEVKTAIGYTSELESMSVVSPFNAREPELEYVCAATFAKSLGTASSISSFLFEHDSAEHAIEKFTMSSQDMSKGSQVEIKEGVSETGGWKYLSVEMKGGSMIISQKDRYLVGVVVSEFEVDLLQLHEIAKIVWGKIDREIAVSEKGEDFPVPDIEPTPATKKVPGWIKNNAKWWSEGQIEDSTFTDGIEFLIKEGIITIPPTTQASYSGVEQIPAWIKNNAAWWADGQIDDDTFIQGIEFLVEQGIIRV